MIDMPPVRGRAPDIRYSGKLMAAAAGVGFICLFIVVACYALGSRP